MAIMAAMVVVMALPAFAQGSQCGEVVSGFALSGQAGEMASSQAQAGGREFGQGNAAFCVPQ